jgi:hypothetical protein
MPRAEADGVHRRIREVEATILYAVAEPAKQGLG